MKPGWFGIWIWRFAAVAAALVALIMFLRIQQSERQPDLKPWHTWAPHEADADRIDEFDWPAWIAAENRVFEDLRAHMRAALEPADRVPANRYFEGSPLNPLNFAQDWNRSFELLPRGAPVGAAVFLHGLTDSPYSLRHVARLYVERGYAAVGIRLPGHGTVPAGLTRVSWQDWRAATRLAVREARRLAGPDKPLHIVGYSNGAALAVQYAADTAADPALFPPQRVVLFSPMIGLTRFARYAGLAGWPAILPRYSKTAWLEIIPEYNPFKYGSFPVNAARQSYELTQVLDEQLAAAAPDGTPVRLPPILAFQSVVDSTVTGEALISTLFARLPANGSEIVLFDVNRAGPMELLLSRPALLRLDQMVPAGPQRYRITVIGNAPGQPRMTESVRLPGNPTAQLHTLDLEYPRIFSSLSHVALPFPCTDSLYGTEPDDENFGVHLGNQALRGERGTLIDGADSLARASCNPFSAYVAARIEEGLAR